MKTRSAYTLTELLVATAVGSIVMAMAFSSFSVINQKYQKYSDMSNLHRGATQILNIIYQRFTHGWLSRFGYS